MQTHYGETLVITHTPTGLEPGPGTRGCVCLHVEGAQPGRGKGNEIRASGFASDTKQSTSSDTQLDMSGCVKIMLTG